MEFESYSDNIVSDCINWNQEYLLVMSCGETCVSLNASLIV